MNPLPDNLTMIARTIGIASDHLPLWEIELHIGSEATCLHLSGFPLNTPPTIEMAWNAVHGLAAQNPMAFPESFRPNPSSFVRRT